MLKFNGLEAIGRAPPPVDPALRHDQPQPAERVRTGEIGCTWPGPPVGMAVPAADDCRAARPRLPLGCEQGAGVDLEGPARLGGHVPGLRHGKDGIGLPQEEAARLEGVGAGTCFEDGAGSPGTDAHTRATVVPGRQVDVGASDRHDRRVMAATDPPAQCLEAILAPDARGWRLDRALAAALPALSRERLKRLVSAGAVTLDGAVARDPALKVAGGERALVEVPAPRPAGNAPQAIALDIVHEDDHLLVVDKPAGLVVHPAAGNADGTLVNALVHHCAGRLSGIGGVARPGIVHRIDKDTSGLLVVAKTDRAHEGLALQFRRHSIERRYLAVCAGTPTPPAGRIETHLARSPVNRQRIAVVDPPRGKRAVTHYRVMRSSRRASLVEARLETGRTHQVRVHLAHLGHPLVGDPFYGQGRLSSVTRQMGFARQALHAATLGFVHPVSGDALSFDSPLPDDIQRLLTALAV